MISLDTTATTNQSTNLNPTIIFESNDFRRDIGLILLKQKKNDEKFELHLHNDYTNQAIAMILDIKDLARMFESLEDYFIKAQTDVYE